MIINPISAIGAARDIGTGLIEGLTDSGKAQGVTPGNQTGLSFSEVMGDMASKAVSDLKGAEAASFAGIKGTMSTREVVDAVMQGEQALQTATALRDKIVSAFLDITRMQI